MRSASTVLTFWIVIVPISTMGALFAGTIYFYRLSLEGLVIVETLSALASVVFADLLVWERLRSSLSKKLNYLHDNYLSELYDSFKRGTILNFYAPTVEKITPDLKRYGKFMGISLYPKELPRMVSNFLISCLEFSKLWVNLEGKGKKLLDQEWSDGSKSIAAQAYKSFCELNDIAIPKHINFNKWSRQPQKLPWVPLEREVDALIAGCSKKVATFLQTLKETGMRCGEAWRLKWIDVDTDHNVITVNNPEKHGVPRQLKISAKLVAMLNGLPKKSERVFASSTLAILRCNFMTQRKKIAFKLKNPRLRRITFHTLRHFKGTMEYHKTKDILHVKELLGHRKISSTLVYTHLVNFESDDYTVRVAKTLREDEELLKAGFEYVTERENLKIYRKRK